jgi:hypothetical protein
MFLRKVTTLLQNYMRNIPEDRDIDTFYEISQIGLGDLGTDMRVIIKTILRSYCRSMWVGFIWHMLRTNRGAYLNNVKFPPIP